MFFTLGTFRQGPFGRLVYLHYSLLRVDQTIRRQKKKENLKKAQNQTHQAAEIHLPPQASQNHTTTNPHIIWYQLLTFYFSMFTSKISSNFSIFLICVMGVCIRTFCLLFLWFTEQFTPYSGVWGLEFCLFIPYPCSFSLVPDPGILLEIEKRNPLGLKQCLFTGEANYNLFGPFQSSNEHLLKWLFR